MARPPGAEAALLAAIHARCEQRAPRLERAVPSHPRPGEPLVLCGANLRPPLQAAFGPLRSWAVVLSERRAVTLVPASGGGGPVWVERHGLRSNRVDLGGPPGGERPWVLRVDPPAGTTGVLRDAPVVVRLSHPAQRESLGPDTVRVGAGGEWVPGLHALSPDGAVVVWSPLAPLAPGLEHVLEVCGLRDRRGLEVRPHRSTFVPGRFSLDDLLEEEASR